MKKIFIWMFRITIAFMVITISWVVAYRFVPIHRTPLMYIRNITDNIPINHKWTPIEEISPEMILAVIAAEDSQYMLHNGFDWQQIEKAKSDAKNGKKLRGASTISQQTAKNVFLWNKRSWLRKGLEAYFTVLIELLWDKERIMEVYLNSIEMGEGLYGIAAVAEANFKKSPAELTQKECALIAATLPNPIKFSSKRPSKYVRQRQSAIIKNMNYIRKTGLDKKRE